MSADAYATAFMVMGLKEAERFADAHPDIDACFIYTNKKGELQTFFTKGWKSIQGKIGVYLIYDLTRCEVQLKLLMKP